MSNQILERRLSGVTVRIDRDRCIANQSCVHIAPEVFALDETQVVTFVKDTTDIPRDRLIEACASCPVDALTALDDRGKPVLP